MDTFNLKKFLTENKLTKVSQLKEGKSIRPESTEDYISRVFGPSALDFIQWMMGMIDAPDAIPLPGSTSIVSRDYNRKKQKALDPTVLDDFDEESSMGWQYLETLDTHNEIYDFIDKNYPEAFERDALAATVTREEE